MLHNNFSQVILYLTIYSAVGWICETIYCSVPARKFVNRGFLKGPVCPMYGFGALIILFLSEPLIKWPGLVFLAATAGATVLEYFTGWLLEALFQVRWWDYSRQKFNLKGRVCLKNSVLFGLLGLALCYFLHPLAERLVGLIPASYQRLAANVILVIFFLDLLTTLNHLLNFTHRLQTLQEELKELKEYEKNYKWFDPNNIDASLRRLREISEKEGDASKVVPILARIDSIEQKRQQRYERIFQAFPGLQSSKLGEAIKTLEERRREQKAVPRQTLSARLKSLDKRVAAGAKAVKTSFLEEFNYYNLFWIFLIASIIGFVVETIFCLVTTGQIESRQGVIYGPICQIYGFGAVLMTLLLKPLASRNDRWVFLGSAIIGGAFEYAASWIQEVIFGTVSWDYSDGAFSIGSGRTSLLFMFFWGILGLWFVKGIYPFLRRLITKIPKRIGRTLTAVLTVLVAADLFLSAAAVSRWSGRDQGLPPSNGFEQFLDLHYDDTLMRYVYPNMKMRNEKE